MLSIDLARRNTYKLGIDPEVLKIQKLALDERNSSSSETIVEFVQNTTFYSIF